MDVSGRWLAIAMNLTSRVPVSLTAGVQEKVLVPFKLSRKDAPAGGFSTCSHGTVPFGSIA